MKLYQVLLLAAICGIGGMILTEILWGFFSQLFRRIKQNRTSKSPNVQVEGYFEGPKSQEPDLNEGDEVKVKFKVNVDIVARQGGQKRNKYHLYASPYGYPIRVCEWVMAGGYKSLEDIRVAKGEYPIQSIVDDTIKEKGEEVFCKHCRAIIDGYRKAGLSQ